MPENKTIQREIGGCTIIISFAKPGEDSPSNLKNNILWHLTQCYEDRIVSQIKANKPNVAV